MENGIQITAWRPERRFGWAIRIWRRDWHTGKLQVLSFGPDSQESWTDVAPNVESAVTMYIDDNVFDALVEFLAPKAPENETATKLNAAARDDAIDVRDRLLTIFEQVMSRRDYPHEGTS